MLDHLSKWVRSGRDENPANTPDQWSRAMFDDLVAQLQKLEQNLQVELAAREWAEQQSERHHQNAKDSAMLAAACNKESELLHKQHGLLAKKLRAAQAELAQLKRGLQTNALPASPTQSEELVREVHDAKDSLMQSQDCMRLMASSAAAAEARANQLQDQLNMARKELAAAELRNADFGSLKKAHENAIAESAGKMCCLQEQLEHALIQQSRLQAEVRHLQSMLAASQCRVKELETASHHSNSRLASHRIGSIGAQNDAEALLLDLHVNPIDRDRELLSVSLPSPLHPQQPQQRDQEVDCSICNLSSPAALSCDLHKGRPAREWQPAAAAQVGQWGSISHNSDQENFVPQLAKRPARRQAEDGSGECVWHDDSPGRMPVRDNKELRSRRPFIPRQTENDGLEGYSTLDQRFRMGCGPQELLRASDFAPLCKGQTNFQAPPAAAVAHASPVAKKVELTPERQPLSPANRDVGSGGPRPSASLRKHSPFSKAMPTAGSPLKPTAGATTTPKRRAGSRVPQRPASKEEEEIPIFSLDMHDHRSMPLQEECGPLGMGSRGVDEQEMCTPPKKGGTPTSAMLRKLAHKVSPMRRGNPFSSPNKLF